MIIFLKYTVYCRHQSSISWSAATADVTEATTATITAIIIINNPPAKIIVVPAGDADASKLPLQLPLDAAVTLLHQPSADYPLKDEKTTYYICRNHSCLPPTNDLRMYDLP